MLFSPLFVVLLDIHVNTFLLEISSCAGCLLRVDLVICWRFQISDACLDLAMAKWAVDVVR